MNERWRDGDDDDDDDEEEKKRKRERRDENRRSEWEKRDKRPGTRGRMDPVPKGD
jgi:hypothetical protein